MHAIVNESHIIITVCLIRWVHEKSYSECDNCCLKWIMSLT